LTERGFQTPSLAAIIAHELAHHVTTASDIHAPPLTPLPVLERLNNYWELVNIIEPWENPIREELEEPARLANQFIAPPNCECEKQ